MHQVLQGLDAVLSYLDDILINGHDTETRMRNLGEVLKRLESYSLRVRRDKSSVSYLGHVIDATGIHPIKENTEAIEQAAVPKNVTELRSFLALLNYYENFVFQTFPQLFNQ